jgi:hypothetical protein
MGMAPNHHNPICYGPVLRLRPRSEGVLDPLKKGLECGELGSSFGADQRFRYSLRETPILRIPRFSQVGQQV